MRTKAFIKNLICASVITVTLNSMSCQRTLHIRNCTNDTLLFVPTTSDTLDDGMYLNDSGYTVSVTCDPYSLSSEDTTVVYAHGEKVILWNPARAFPDSLVLVAPDLFNTKDTCYIYAIKWHDATHYLLNEIREKHLYDRRVITIKDFQNRYEEYKYKK